MSRLPHLASHPIRWRPTPAALEILSVVEAPILRITRTDASDRLNMVHGPSHDLVTQQAILLFESA
ncbi:hypothetical protein ACFY05_39845 [Microtetraspora fusca]|uniref:Uncharacterized protein n=1 Tax=Microtetraspora fusca TaxID=1997 RepID=A0ABW6VIT1_MICFU